MNTKVFRKFYELLIALIFIISSLLISCSEEKGGFLGPYNKTMIIVASGSVNSSGIAAYDTEGNFLFFLRDYRTEGGSIRAISYYDEESILVTLDNADRLERLYFNGETETFYGSNLLSGNIYGVRVDSNGDVLVIESNNLEKITSEGERTPPTGNAYIQGSISGCTFSNPRLIYMQSNDELIVVNNATDGILTIDVSTATPTCSSSQSFTNNPYGVVLHSDGNLYVTTQGDDSVYQASADGSSASKIWTTDTTIINNPTAIIEHPSGDLLVAAYSSGSVERITTAGVRVGAEPFIKSPYTYAISDMLIVRGAE